MNFKWRFETSVYCTLDRDYLVHGNNPSYIIQRWPLIIRLYRSTVRRIGYFLPITSRLEVSHRPRFSVPVRWLQL